MQSWVLEGLQSGKFKKPENSGHRGGTAGEFGIGEPESSEMETPSYREPIA